MFSAVVSRLIMLVFGTLYPAYASYKAVRTKNVKEYVKWMMYWIVFALFSCLETFTDVFLCWFPFYYELKIVIVLWLLSPATKGSSILYRKFVHPMLSRREQEIDEYISKAKEQGYSTVVTLGAKGVNYATSVIMQTAIKNLNLNANELTTSRSDSNVKNLVKTSGDDVDAFKRSQSINSMMEIDNISNKPEISSDSEDISLNEVARGPKQHMKNVKKVRRSNRKPTKTVNVNDD